MENLQSRLLSHRLESVIRDFHQPVMIWQAAILVGALCFAWVTARFVHGRSNRQIASRLGMSEKTASVHVSNLMAKLQVTSRAAAAAAATRLGLVDRTTRG